jgi:hypothetical protein
MTGDETARLLNTAAERRAMADRHEAEAVRLSYEHDADSLARSAHHFTIAAGLRGQARFR